MVNYLVGLTEHQMVVSWVWLKDAMMVDEMDELLAKKLVELKADL
jgi:hypothetical protein